MLRTLRARLTALATGITLTVSLIVCVALYIGIRFSLHREVDAFLAGEVMEFRTILSAVDGDLVEVQRRVRAELGSRQRGDLAFRLLAPDGSVLLTSDTANTLPDPWPVPPQRPADPFFRTERGTTSGAPTRTCSQWVTRPDGTTRIVQATYLLDQVNASLSRFIQICGAALSAAAILAMIGGRILASRSLRPVGTMATAARKISVENLTERLDRSGTGDEVDCLAQTFNDMLTRLEKQVTQLRQFTADAAHELRTPLAALRGNAEVALSGRRPADELRAVLADAIEEYDRLARIADDLLLLARADAGQRLIQPARFRLDRAVVDVVDLFSPAAEERGVSLTLSDCNETWIDGDDGRLRQMLGNLLDNAIKFTPDGGTVRVSLSAANGVAELTVRDTGVGIAPEHLPHVFDRFYRIDRARTHDGGGAGLGLSISRTIAEAHGGSIRLISEPGDETTVSVRIPVEGGSKSLC
ncbi:MAG TPA: heavy metal sensor histidine kinase [Phycisphaerae bacterium]|nr:heavy metal sensor histidine kinase [Phycisphaerae bacterium]